LKLETIRVSPLLLDSPFAKRSTTRVRNKLKNSSFLLTPLMLGPPLLLVSSFPAFAGCTLGMRRRRRRKRKRGGSEGDEERRWKCTGR